MASKNKQGISYGLGRSRSWTFIIYPDSAPKNWKEKIDSTHLQWIESPLHDKDVNPDGTLKKAHWHVLLMFDSVKTFEQVKKFTDELSAPIPQKCASARGLVRYMAHLDNPEKHQYDVADIRSHNGADLNELLRLTATEKYVGLQKILDFAEQKSVYEYYDLVMLLQDYNYDLFKLAVDNTIFLNTMIRSKRHKRKYEHEQESI